MPKAQGRPKLVHPAEEMKHISALIAAELLQWDGVTEKSMFGMRAFYRRGVIFAALPATRAMHSPRAISYKDGASWRLVEVHGDPDIHKALACLDRAYHSI